MKRKALIIAVVGGFLSQFEKENVRLLQSKGYEVHYAADFEHPFYELNTGELADMGVRLHPVPIRKSPFVFKDNLRAYLVIRRIVREEKITLIHCHNPVGGVIGRLCGLGIDPRPYVIYTAHGFHFYRGCPVKNRILYEPVERLMAHFSDEIITINREDYAASNTFHMRRGASRTWIKGVGVDDEKFRPRPDSKKEVRSSLNIPEGAFHILSAGEFNRNKNFGVVISAINKLVNIDKLPGAENIRYSIAGDGFCHNEWQRLIDSYGLEKHVRFIGFRTDMERVLQSADVFCFPSVREGLGVAAIEALLSGVPLICADNRGTREFAVDGTNAIVVGATDADGFADAIKRLYEDRGLLKRLSDNAVTSAAPFVRSETVKSMAMVYERADG